jgi:hypothetical protein
MASGEGDLLVMGATYAIDAIASSLTINAIASI